MKLPLLFCLPGFLLLISLNARAQEETEADTPPLPNDPELQKLDAQYRKLIAEQVEAIYEVPLQKLTEQYVSLLQAEKEKAVDEGDLEKTIAWSTELARVTEAEPPARSTATAVPRLERMQEVYEENASPLRSRRTQKLSQLNAFYVKALESRERELTAEGAVELAVQIRDWRLSQVLPEAAPVEEKVASLPIRKSLSGAEIDEGELGAIYTLPLPEGLEMTFSWCPPGTYTMGSPLDEEGRETEFATAIMDETQQEVEIEEGFWMAQTEVTQAQWMAFMETTIADQQAMLRDSQTQEWFQLGKTGLDYPMAFVNYHDAEEFIEEMNRELELYDWIADMPSEEEWEYACRAGTTGPYAGPDVDSLAWHIGNSDRTEQPVATKDPNPWGIYDMHGGLRELASSSGSSVVARGGCFLNPPLTVRSAMRFEMEPIYRVRSTGFRVLLRPD